MKSHHGMRPQDIVVLLKISTMENKRWLGKDLAMTLFISQSEVSESLTRSEYAGLLSNDKRKLMRQSFVEFLEHGFKYTFPQRPGPVVRGMPTAHSAAPLNSIIHSNEIFVWPDALGNDRGQGIEPLYSGVVKAAKVDSDLYQLLSILDSIRVGKVRDREIAINELKNRILYQYEKGN